jgi:DNA-binding IclR family transcriptional regulator
MAAKRIQSISRATLVIQTLAEEHRPLGVMELARATNLAPSTVQRVLATLVDHHWVESTNGRFRPGFALLGAGAASVFYSPLVEKAHGLLAELAEIAALQAYLCVLVGARVAYLARSSGKDSRPSRFQAGLLQRAPATASGKLLLASLDRATLVPLLDKSWPWPAYTQKTIVNRKEFDVELETIRLNGYALDRGERVDSFRAIAVPVRSGEDSVIAALQLGGQPEAATDARLLAALDDMRMLSTELSMQLTDRD